MLKLVVIASIAVSVSACSTFKRRVPNQQQDEMKVVLKDKDGNIKEASGLPKTIDGKEVTKIEPHSDAEIARHAGAEEVKEAVSAAADHIAATHGKESAGHRKIGSVPAHKALGWLKNGNTRFVKGRFRSDGVSAKDRKRLLAGENPHSIVIASSDSRIPPEVIFDQKLGEIFVVRGAVAASDIGILSSVEYATLDLGPNLIVVLGNTSKDSWENVDRLAQELQDRSEILRDAIASGDVKIVTAIYNLETGVVNWR